MHCSGNLDTYLNKRSKKYRYGLRKKLKTFNSASNTRVDRHTITTSQDPSFDQMVSVSRRSWKSANRTDLGSYKDNREFLGALIDSLGPSGRSEIWIAYRDHEPIAYELHLRSGKVTFPIQADYDESARTLSPGSIVEHYALRAIFEDPVLEIYDSCAANYWYLKRLTDSYRETYDTMIFSRSIQSGLIQLSEFLLKPALIRLRSAFRKRHD